MTIISSKFGDEKTGLQITGKAAENLLKGILKSDSILFDKQAKEYLENDSINKIMAPQDAVVTMKSLYNYNELNKYIIGHILVSIDELIDKGHDFYNQFVTISEFLSHYERYLPFKSRQATNYMRIRRTFKPETFLSIGATKCLELLRIENESQRIKAQMKLEEDNFTVEQTKDFVDKIINKENTDKEKEKEKKLEEKKEKIHTAVESIPIDNTVPEKVRGKETFVVKFEFPDKDLANDFLEELFKDHLTDIKVKLYDKWGDKLDQITM